MTNESGEKQEASGGGLKEKVIDVLKSCYDPEIPVNIYELGLIYSVEVEGEGDVHVNMTLTSPACPVATSLPPEVQEKIKRVPGVTSSKVDVVWEPPWKPEMMTEAAKLQLGIM
ncbi:MAG: SUF system Fe-S cluster assembly protein [Deltaproteobacteria bacterium]|nr:SUF system Fe-S cluster assembly protein [Deltaproteobacteria bacterium]